MSPISNVKIYNPDIHATDGRWNIWKGGVFRTPIPSTHLPDTRLAHLSPPTTLSLPGARKSYQLPQKFFLRTKTRLPTSKEACVRQLVFQKKVFTSLYCSSAILHGLIPDRISVRFEHLPESRMGVRLLGLSGPLIEWYVLFSVSGRERF